MIFYLDNPVFNALISGDAHRANGSAHVKYFDQEVSPFVGFDVPYKNGFTDLHQLLPSGRNILYACRHEIPTPTGWDLKNHISGNQFLFESKNVFEDDFSEVSALNKNHVDEMIQLATLTKPGPFDKRTIEFGNYHGIFKDEKLVAITGRRLHVYDFTEVSAVCTHPDYTGNGFAANLIKHQINSILKENKTPFLHVRSDNNIAIGLYKKLGFVQNGHMHFYFLRRID